MLLLNEVEIDGGHVHCYESEYLCVRTFSDSSIHQLLTRINLEMRAQVSAKCVWGHVGEEQVVQGRMRVQCACTHYISRRMKWQQ